MSYASAKLAFQDLLIQQLAADTAELLSRGVHRNYQRVSADLANPRGRIDLPGFSIPPGTKTVLPCAYHPRTEDTVLNQVILAGLAYSTRLTADNDLRSYLHRLRKILGATVSHKRLDPTLLARARRTMDRRTTLYMSALVVIELLIQAEGISFKGEAEYVSLPGFLFDMNRFFQALMSRFLRDHLEGFQ